MVTSEIVGLKSSPASQSYVRAGSDGGKEAKRNGKMSAVYQAAEFPLLLPTWCEMGIARQKKD
jgi:hypothetical protein